MTQQSRCGFMNNFYINKREFLGRVIKTFFDSIPLICQSSYFASSNRIVPSFVKIKQSFILMQDLEKGLNRVEIFGALFFKVSFLAKIGWCPNF